MLQIYTDGAYKSSIDQGGIGIVWMKDDEVFKKYSGSKRLSAMVMVFAKRNTTLLKDKFLNKK